ncbi:hypothetical protein D3C81_1483280 [compost metagenome]
MVAVFSCPLFQVGLELSRVGGEEFGRQSCSDDRVLDVRVLQHLQKEHSNLVGFVEARVCATRACSLFPAIITHQVATTVLRGEDVPTQSSTKTAAGIGCNQGWIFPAGIVTGLVARRAVAQIYGNQLLKLHRH